MDIPVLEKRFDALIEEGAAFDADMGGGKTLRVFRENTKVDIPAVLEGTALAAGEILADPGYAEANGLAIGSNVEVGGRRFRVAGTVSLPNYIYPLKSEGDFLRDPQSFGIAVIGKDDFEALGRGQRFYAVKFRSGDAAAQGRDLREYLKGQNAAATSWTPIADNLRVAYVETKIQGINEVSSSLPVFILLITCVLTGIVIRRLICGEAAIIGTLYALGYRKGELLRHYLRFPLWIAVAGGVLGTAIGAALVMPMLTYMVSFFNMPLGGVRFDPAYIAAGILLPAALLCVSGYFAVRGELKRPAAELMHGSRREEKPGRLERALKLERLKFPAKFKIRAQLRSLPRAAFLLLGVALASMLLLLGFTVQSSMDSLMNENLKGTFRFQYEYVYAGLNTQAAPAGAESFSSLPVTAKQDGTTEFRILGIQPGSKMLSLKGASGTLDTGRVIVTRPLADKLHIAPGDKMTAADALTAAEYTVTVDAVAETYIGSYIFMPLSSFNTMLGRPENSHTGLWSDAKLDIPEGELLSAHTLEQSMQEFTASLQPLTATVGVIALMAFLIGLIVIYVVVSLIIEENRGSISLLKVFGYRKKEVNALVINSSGPVVIAGYALGIPLVLAAMKAMFVSLGESVKLTLPVVLQPGYMLVGLAAVYATYVIARVFAGRKIRRIPMDEALKAERD